MDRRPRSPYECECGINLTSVHLPQEKRRHTLLHREYIEGIKLTKSFPRELIEDGIAVVAAREKGPAAKLAYKMAWVAQRAGHYDFVSFYPGSRDSDARAHLYVEDEKVIAYLLADWCSHWGEIDFSNTDENAEVYPERRPMVGLVFVRGGHRRRGLAKRLVERLASDQRLDSPAALVWEWPFTDAGLALARHYCGDKPVRTGK